MQGMRVSANALEPSLQALHQNNQSMDSGENKGYIGGPLWKGGNESWSREKDMNPHTMKSLKLMVPT